MRVYLLYVAVYGLGLCAGALLAYLGQRLYWRQYVKRIERAYCEDKRRLLEAAGVPYVECHAEPSPYPPESPSLKTEPDGSYEDYR